MPLSSLQVSGASRCASRYRPSDVLRFALCAPRPCRDGRQLRGSSGGTSAGPPEDGAPSADPLAAQRVIAGSSIAAAMQRAVREEGLWGKGEAVLRCALCSPAGLSY